MFSKIKSIASKRIRHFFVYPFHGLVSFIKDEASATFLILGTIATYVAAYLSDFTALEYVVISCVITIAFIVELLNSAIENVVDLATSEIHPYAKKAKDQGAMAEFAVVAMWATVTILLVFDVISL